MSKNEKHYLGQSEVYILSLEAHLALRLLCKQAQLTPRFCVICAVISLFANGTDAEGAPFSGNITPCDGSIDYVVVTTR